MGRIAAALQMVISTLISVVTLPFRLLSKLIGGGGAGRRPATRTRRPRRRAF
jgi:hypothetical protein